MRSDDLKKRSVGKNFKFELFAALLTVLCSLPENDQYKCDDDFKLIKEIITTIQKNHSSIFNFSNRALPLFNDFYEHIKSIKISYEPFRVQKNNSYFQLGEYSLINCIKDKKSMLEFISSVSSKKNNLYVYYYNSLLSQIRINKKTPLQLEQTITKLKDFQLFGMAFYDNPYEIFTQTSSQIKQLEAEIANSLQKSNKNHKKIKLSDTSMWVNATPNNPADLEQIKRRLNPKLK